MKDLVEPQVDRGEKFLYHYTSLKGFFGIIDTKKIWATNIMYLNDTEEFKQAVNITLNAIEILADSPISKEERIFVDKLYDHVLSFTKMETDLGIYVCSFSENPDQLSQWRGYCPEASGICISFDFNSELSEQVKKQGFRLVKCEYCDFLEIPPVYIQNVLNGVLRTYQTMPKRMKFAEKINKSLDCFDQKFQETAVTVKHPAFIEEGEWRLISGPTRMTNLDIKFRSGKSLLIPYIEIKLADDKNDPLNIPEIWVGPTPHPNLSIQAVSSFLGENHVFAYKKQLPETPFDDGNKVDSKERVTTPVYASNAPYRTW